MSEEIRCFLAFDIEDNEVLRKLINVQQLLVNSNSSLKIIKPENIHITLNFLGNISSDLINKISNKLLEITFIPFYAELKGIGVFPKISRPRIIWVGIAKGSEEMKKIFNQITQLLKKFGFSFDYRGFSPHLTIARVKTLKNKEQLINFVKKNSNYYFGKIKIKSFKLKKSDLSPLGPIYTTLNQFDSKTEV